MRHMVYENDKRIRMLLSSMCSIYSLQVSSTYLSMIKLQPSFENVIQMTSPDSDGCTEQEEKDALLFLYMSR